MSTYKNFEINNEFYEANHKLTPNNVEDIIEQKNEHKRFRYSKKSSYYNYFFGFYSDLYKFNLIASFLEKYPNHKKNKIFNNHLDIGAREGFIGRLLKGAKYVQNTFGLDIVDLRPNLFPSNRLPYSILMKFNLDRGRHYLNNQEKTGLEIDKSKYFLF